VAGQEGHGRPGHDHVVGKGDGDQPLEHPPGLALAVEVDLGLASAGADEGGPDADRGADGHPLGVGPPAALGGLLDRHRGVGRARRRVLDRLDAEDGHEARGAQLLDPSPEAPHLADHDFRRPAGVQARIGVRERREPDAQEGEAAALPPNRQRRERRGGRGRRRVEAGHRRSRGADRTRTAARIAPEPVLDHPVPERVPGDAEPLGRPRDVPAGLAEGLEDVDALHLPDGVLERRRRDRGLALASSQLSGETQHLGRHGRGLREEGHALHHVGQFPDVPGPRVREERLARVRRQGAWAQTVLRAGPRQEALGEIEHVRAAIAQGRDPQGDDRQPVVEVLAKAALAHRATEVLVGGRHDPDVHRLAPRAAEPPDRAVLERREELGLERLREEADLVEEERAAVRELEASRLRVLRVGEGAPLDAEQLGLEQGLGDRRAVDVDEGLARAGARPVQDTDQQALAGAGLPLDQDRRQASPIGLAPKQSLRLLAESDHPRALPDQLVQRGHGPAHPTPPIPQAQPWGTLRTAALTGGSSPTRGRGPTRSPTGSRGGVARK
jgi:hypothetical protein